MVWSLLHDSFFHGRPEKGIESCRSAETSSQLDTASALMQAREEVLVRRVRLRERHDRRRGIARVEGGDLVVADRGERTRRVQRRLVGALEVLGGDRAAVVPHRIRVQMDGEGHAAGGRRRLAARGLAARGLAGWGLAARGLGARRCRRAAAAATAAAARRGNQSGPSEQRHELGAPRGASHVIDLLVGCFGRSARAITRPDASVCTPRVARSHGNRPECTRRSTAARPRALPPLFSLLWPMDGENGSTRVTRR